VSHIEITYLIDAAQSKEIIEAIRVEQTIEYPFDLAPEWIQNEIVGQLVSEKEYDKSRKEIIISYNTEITGFEIGQLLNVVWGNVSLFKNVKIIKINFPEHFLNSFKGPRFGTFGLRKSVNAIKRPILATALKPMGLSSSELAKMAAIMVEAGIDLIKDDHSLANQKWSVWNERVKIISDSVNEANVKYNRNSIYLPSMNRPAEQILDAAIKAKEIGCGAVLVLPGITGFDSMRMIADCDDFALPIMSHPANLGSYFMNPTHGLTHEIILATLTRLSGGDMSIFPNFAGRFSFSKDECLTIANSCREKLANLKTIMPTVGGGMTLERINEIVDFYGNDSVLLIGGALHRGNLLENALRFRELVEQFEN
jgi:ribulose-bisphosphate carboxylase large chain